jgi:hypothetical protein
MADEILAIPEEYLQEVIAIIRVGIHHAKDDLPKKPSKNVINQLRKWCDEEEAYLKRLNEP